MYHYISDPEFLGKLHRECSDVVNRLVQNINQDNFMMVKQHIVGSGAKNLIVQNSTQPIDLDYNLEIISCKNWYNCKKIKNYVMKHFNEVLCKLGYDNCKDSTSVISTGKRCFIQGNKTQWSIDVAIVCKCEGHWERLIHKKTDSMYPDSWEWETAPKSKNLDKKVSQLKKINKWLEVRKCYLEKKNLYLKRNEENNHPSFNVYIEVINELYNKYL